MKRIIIIIVLLCLNSISLQADYFGRKKYLKFSKENNIQTLDSRLKKTFEKLPKKDDIELTLVDYVDYVIFSFYIKNSNFSKNSRFVFDIYVDNEEKKGFSYKLPKRSINKYLKFPKKFRWNRVITAHNMLEYENLFNVYESKVKQKFSKKIKAKYEKKKKKRYKKVAKEKIFMLNRNYIVDRMIYKDVYGHTYFNLFVPKSFIGNINKNFSFFVVYSKFRTPKDRKSFYENIEKMSFKTDSFLYFKTDKEFNFKESLLYHTKDKRVVISNKGVDKKALEKVKIKKEASKKRKIEEKVKRAITKDIKFTNKKMELNYYLNLINQDPDNAKLYWKLSQTLFKKYKDIENAYKYYLKAIELDKTYMNIDNNGLLDEAISKDIY